jgi:hypothetical protein
MTPRRFSRAMQPRTTPLSLAGAAMLLLASSSNSFGALAALYQFDNAGTSQPDATLNANTATALNGAAWIFDGVRNSGTFSFDGSDDRLQALDSASLSITGDLTISLWVNVTSAGGFGQWRGLVTKDPAGSGTAAPYQFWFNQANLFPNFVGGNGTTNDIAFSTIDVPSTGVWEHWAVTLTGNTVAMYRNGSPITMADTTITSPVADGNGPLIIGDRDGAQDMSFLGRLDDVAIFNEALDQTEIQTVMSGDFTAFGVPEPSQALMLACGMAGFLARRRRR